MERPLSRAPPSLTHPAFTFPGTIGHCRSFYPPWRTGNRAYRELER